MTTHRGKILVLRGGAIGDFILTLPVLAALRRQFPQAPLEVLGYPHIAQLALASGLVDEVRPIESRGLAGFFARRGELEERLADYFAGFALILSFLYDPDGILRENVARCSEAQFIAGPHRPDERQNTHASDVFLKPLERLAIFDADPVPRLKLAAHAPGAQVARHPCGDLTRGPETAPFAGQEVGAAGGWLALHPGSGSEEKNWPEENWTRLIQCLQTTTRLDFLLLGGEAERERVRRLSAKFRPDRFQLAQGLPLAELARRLQPCAGFIGHDSGISHLAAAVGLPTLVLWGRTNETIWRPRGDHVTVLRSPEGLPGLSVERVFEESKRFLSP